MTAKKRKLQPTDFAKMWQDKLSPYVAKKIKAYNFTCQDITLDERDYWLKKIIDTLLAKYIVYSGKHRIGHWEKGWGQNLNELSQNKKVQAIVPHYYNKYPVLRINKKLIKPLSANFERNSLYIIQDWLFDKYLRKADAIYEFGCGTGHNLFRAREVNKQAEIWGLDWVTSSQKIINKLNRSGVDKKIFAHKFDFFNPDKNFELKNNSVVYTVAALEQIGSKYKKFVAYLLKNKPGLCIHIEPIAELLDENNLIDYLSIEYFKKRKYLSGYLTYLRELEKEGKIKIIKTQRSYIGSLFIEGYSVIVWRPN
jgi:trans-aconitate methyltransferase